MDFRVITGGAILSLIAGGITLLVSHDESYDLMKYSEKFRKNYLKKILIDNKVK